MKLPQVIDDILSTMRGIAKMEIDKAKVIPALKKEYKDLRKEYFDLERINNNQTQYTRKLNSIRRRFENADKEPGYTWECFCSECENELLAEYSKPIFEKVEAGVAKPISVTSPLLEEEIQEQKELWEKHQQSIKEVTALKQRLDREKLELKDYRRNWSPEKITRFLQSPTDAEFDRAKCSVLELIDADAFKKWQANKSKLAEESRKANQRAKREREKEIAYRRRFRDEAIKICSGKLPFPDELKNNHTAHTIDIATLSWFLRTRHEKKLQKQQVVNS